MSDNIQLSINTFDSIILGILCLSAIIAFFRGFVREVLSLGAWVGAAVITLYFFPNAEEFMKHHIKDEKVAAGSAALGVYITSLISISILNSIIIKYVKAGSDVGLLDNFLGLLFGGLRGLFIVSLGFLIMSAFVPKDSPPAWLKTSITKPYLKETSDILVKIAPNYLRELEDMVKEQTKPKKEEDKVDDIKDDIKGKSSDSKQDLQRLIDNHK